MGKAEQVRNLKEYAGWIHTMKNNPPWADKAKTPAQKVQGVTHPAGESVGSEILGSLMKDSKVKGLRSVGQGLGRVGPILDILTSPKDAW
ncbi:hypothetical protein [Pseudodesulfovibrio indicus]|uniref:Uncharacterized protein n=2 Tax=Pseudodesulfovibrio TaxID=2035811 RepID=A0ABN4LWS8_9BACT|nr:hypothetical protein [Pseudodesulfovibrio indicus]AMK10156.1 hypothetical protein AWY79_03010 [Pseudodesulfovibrio indicus]